MEEEVGRLRRAAEAAEPVASLEEEASRLAAEEAERARPEAEASRVAAEQAEWLRLEEEESLRLAAAEVERLRLETDVVREAAGEAERVRTPQQNKVEEEQQSLQQATFEEEARLRAVQEQGRLLAEPKPGVLLPWRKSVASRRRSVCASRKRQSKQLHSKPPNADGCGRRGAAAPSRRSH